MHWSSWSCGNFFSERFCFKSRKSLLTLEFGVLAFSSTLESIICLLLFCLTTVMSCSISSQLLDSQNNIFCWDFKKQISLYLSGSYRSSQLSVLASEVLLFCCEHHILHRSSCTVSVCVVSVFAAAYMQLREIIILPLTPQRSQISQYGFQ